MSEVINVLFLIYVGLTVVVLITERRNPTSTMAWMLVLILVPFVGFVLYLLFGRDVSKRKIFYIDEKDKKELFQIVEAQGDFIKMGELNYKDESVRIHLPLIQMNLKGARAIYSQDNEVEVLIDGKDKFTRLFQSIRQAKRQIHLEYYIVKNDALANRLIDLLIEKAREGICVRFLVDFLGSRVGRKRLREMEDAGIYVAKFFPTKFLPFIEVMLNNRNHRKIVVIDGSEAYLGGYNVGNEYIGLDESLGQWRDTHIILRGSGVLEVQNRFLLDWRASGGNTDGFEKFSFPRTQGAGQVGLQIVSSGPESQMEQIKYSYLSMINCAKRYILIQSPYFIPDEAMQDALRIALLKGVEVSIMIPNKPDHLFVYWASYSYIGDLLGHGLKAYIYEAGFMHAKTMVIDDEVFSCGTANFDIRSFRLNFEINAFIYDVGLARDYRHIFEDDVRRSRRMTQEDYQNRSRLIKFKEPISRLLSPLL